MKRFTWMVFLALAFVACEGDEPPVECDVRNFGFITFNNLVDNAVEVTINDTIIGTVAANDSLRHEQAAGTLVISAREDKFLFPKSWDVSFMLDVCEEVEQVFEP